MMWTVREKKEKGEAKIHTAHGFFFTVIETERLLYLGHLVVNARFDQCNDSPDASLVGVNNPLSSQTRKLQCHD